MNMLSMATQATVKPTLALTVVIFLLGNITAVGNAQVLSSQGLIPQEQDRKFESVRDSFSIAVPQGWVIEDVLNTDTDALLGEMQQGARLLARLCPQVQALPGAAAGTYNCEQADERIDVQRYPNLADEPEFASIANSDTTNKNFLSYHMMKLQKLGYTDLSILQNINTTIDIISADTNNTIGIVPGNLIEMRYKNPDSVDTRGYFLLAATNATSKAGIISGYSLSYEADGATLPSANPPEIGLIFQSFEFVKEATVGPSDMQGKDAGDYENPAAILGIPR
jgi:hypothetical protein